MIFEGFMAAINNELKPQLFHQDKAMLHAMCNNACDSADTLDIIPVKISVEKL